MHQRAGQAVIPGRIGIVEVRPGILGHVQAAPPQVHVQLVGMGRAVGELRRPQVSPGIFAVDLIAEVAR